MVVIVHKNNMKKCKFFVVLGNGQALFGIQDTDALNIIKININSIGTEYTRDGNWCANMHTVQGSNPKQETNAVEKCCTNMDSSSNSTENNTKPLVKTKANKSTEYFLSGANYDSNKQVLKQHSRYIETLMMCLMVLVALKAHFHCSLSQTARITRHH